MTKAEERKAHQKPLSATEKILKIQQLKSEGKTQAATAQELKCSLRTVKYYWNCQETVSKQEQKRKPKPLRKRSWTKRKGGHAEYYRERSYGISHEQYMELLDKQDSKCAICGIHQDNLPRALCVDHDHVTNNVRGLLCPACNVGLGCFKDNAELLTNAIAYLDKHSMQKCS